MKHYLFFQTKCSVNWKKCSTAPWKYLLRIEAMVEVGVWCFPYRIFSPTTHRVQIPDSRLLTSWLIEQKPLHQAPDWMCLHHDPLVVVLEHDTAFPLIGSACSFLSLRMRLYLTYRVISLVYSHIWVFTYWLFSRSLSQRQGIFVCQSVSLIFWSFRHQYQTPHTLTRTYQW